MALRFCVREHGGGVRLRELCHDLGMEDVRDEPFDLLAVHANTDSVALEVVTRILKAGGVFVNYTGSPQAWVINADGSIHGNTTELLNRLGRLTKPVSREALKQALHESTEDLDAAREILVAIVILCQGYLVTHAGVDGLPLLERDDTAYHKCEESLEAMGWKALCSSQSAACVARISEAARHRSEFVVPSFWANVFDRSRPSLAAVPAKVRVSPVAIERLLGCIWDETADHPDTAVRPDTAPNSIPPLAVAEAYLEAAQLLPKMS